VHPVSRRARNRLHLLKLRSACRSKWMTTLLRNIAWFPQAMQSTTICTCVQVRRGWQSVTAAQTNTFGVNTLMSRQTSEFSIVASKVGAGSSGQSTRGRAQAQAQLAEQHVADNDAEEDGVLHVWLRVVVLPPHNEGYDRGIGGGSSGGGGASLPGRLLARGHALLFGHRTSVPPINGRGGPQLCNAASLLGGGTFSRLLRSANLTLW
jgi:hypothetical protein